MSPGNRTSPGMEQAIGRGRVRIRGGKFRTSIVEDLKWFTSSSYTAGSLVRRSRTQCAQEAGTGIAVCPCVV